MLLCFHSRSIALLLFYLLVRPATVGAYYDRCASVPNFNRYATTTFGMASTTVRLYGNGNPYLKTSGDEIFSDNTQYKSIGTGLLIKDMYNLAH